MNENTLNDVTPEFLSDVLITAFDGGYGACSYWAHFVDSDEADDILLSVSIREMDEAEEPTGPVLLVDHDTIRRGIQYILDDDCTDNFPAWYVDLALAVEDSDAGDIDADMADAIVQVALFNEIVYG